MEIEAKFGIPNRQVYRAFLRLRTLAGFAVVPAGAINVTDHYVDTPDARLLAAKYACRLRSEGKSVLVSLKGLGGAEGAIHHRDEREVELSELNLDVRAWPESPARDLALSLTGGALLQSLFDLEQHRVRADVVEAIPEGSRHVAQLSLDEVRAAVGRRPAYYYELEVELTGEGMEEHLARIAKELEETYHLTPEPRSKFERALATLQSRGAAVEARLSAEERAALQEWAARPDAEQARRAAVILAWSEGLPTREAAARSGLSAGRVRFWLRAFRERRMGVFEDEAPGPSRGRSPRGGVSRTRIRDAVVHDETRGAAWRAGDRNAADDAAPGTASHEAGRGARKRKAANAGRGRLPKVMDLARQYEIDLPHARRVADHAEKLFGLLRPMHHLPRKRKRLLRQAALLAAVGAQADTEHPHHAGRDLILAQPLHDVQTNDRLVLACVVAFQRGKVKPEKEPTMVALEPKQREQVLALAALLRVAEGLDFSRSRTTEIVSAEGVETACCEIVLSGADAGVDALQAAERGRLWRKLFQQELIFVVDQGRQEGETGASATAAEKSEMPRANGSATVTMQDADTESETHAPSETAEPLQAEDPMSEAGRKLLRLHLGRMLANEEGTRAGEDPEALHDMRVATRRMRAAHDIFASYYDDATLKPFLKGLRRTGRTLGAVRDLDVLIEKAEAYRAGLPPEGTGDGGSAGDNGGYREIEPLLDEWHARREVARRQMLEYLDGRSYRDFVADFTVFLNTPGAGALAFPEDPPVPYQVRHVVPRLIFTRYEAVRAYEPVIANAPLTTYHLLRIDCKRLRYALEFFRDVLGPEAPGVIKQVTAMQDVLGALQDAHVAEGLIAEFLQNRSKGKKKAAALEGVRLYLNAQRAVQQDLLAQFPLAWMQLTGAEFRRTLALAVAAL